MRLTGTQCQNEQFMTSPSPTDLAKGIMQSVNWSPGLTRGSKCDNLFCSFCFPNWYLPKNSAIRLDTGTV